jgi:hypothetical protein
MIVQFSAAGCPARSLQMIISRSVLWAILIGFFVLTAAAVVLVNKNVRWAGRTAVDYEAAEVMDVW